MSLTVPRAGRAPQTATPYVFHGGTYNGTPVALAAGLATLNILEEPGVLEHLDRRAAQLRDGLVAIASRHGSPLKVLGRGSVVDFYFADTALRTSRDVWASDLPRRRALDYRLLASGVYNAPVHRYHLSLAHSEADLAMTLDRIERALTV
jgi:glutamate-1-semialdehyde 2,1-aminomutase